MTMRFLLGAAFATGLMLAVSNANWAQDTVRLGGPSAQADIAQGGTDTELVRHGYYHGGYRGGYYGGYRGYYGGGFYRPYYYGGYYRPYYYGGYYRPYYYSSYYSPYYGGYYGSGYYGGGYPYGGYYGCSGVSVPVVTAQAVYQSPAVQTQQQYMPPASEQIPMPMAPGSTYPYDGGPKEPVPLPNRPSASPPNAIVPIDGRLVSLPTQTGGGTSAIRMTSGRAPTSASSTRITYPAYGDEPIPAVPRKR